jgi:CheY-like chemotaxis protein
MMATQLATGRILIVDDEEDNCANVSDILSDLGYSCDVAHNGIDALKFVRNHSYDVALLDFKMPGMDGLTLYRELKKIQPGTVAMLVTAYAGTTTDGEVRDTGVWKLVRKPVDVANLLQLVADALTQPLILVIDDDTDFCESLWEVLHERDYRVCIAHNQDEALRRIDHPNYQVALIDLKLGDGDGACVFRQLREANPAARTILVTGFQTEMEPLISELRESGADAVCYKPLDVSKLVDTIGSLVSQEA